ncbi:glutaredoxin-like [Argonauta hians]
MGNFIARAPLKGSPEFTKFVEKTVNDNCVVVFSKTYCPHCTTVKTIFDNLDINYKIIELNRRDDGEQILSTLHEMTSKRTVPRVFVNGDCIGGCDDTKALYKSGKLLEIITQCRPQ